jgi:hypothetical protein
MAFADRAESRDLPDKLGALADLLERKGIKPEDIGKVNRISAWQTGYKDADGAAQTLDLVGIQFSPSWDDGPAWDPVRPASTYGVKAKEVICRQCLDSLRATQTSSPGTATGSATTVTSETSPGARPSTTGSGDAQGGRQNENESTRSGGTSSHQEPSTPWPKHRGTGALSVGRPSPADMASGTSITTTRVAPRVSGVVGSACVVCSAPCVTATLAGTKGLKTQRRSSGTSGALRTALLVPDAQVGYVGDEPMHDEQALTLVVEMARNPDITDVVILGDMLDLAGMSRFGGPPTLTQRVQPAIDRLHEFLAQLRAAAPNATFSYLAGNHEERMAKTLAANAAEAFGLRRAGIPDSWPVLSPPYLLRLDELGVRYHGGYPAGAVWLRDDIKVLHGKRTTAERASKDNIAGVSQFFGHTHRLEVKSKTHEGRNGTIVPSLHVSCGTLARIDGTVPSFGSGTDDSGRPVRSVEDWQQGCVVLTFDADEVGTPPTVELVPFHNGSALWRGKAYRA